MDLIEHLFCPKCGQKSLEKDNLKFQCHNCHHVYYQNVAAATAVFLMFDGDLLMTRRAKDPAKGFLDLPGGFVDAGENVEQGLQRELEEELKINIPLEKFKYWKSYSNIYPYKGIKYYTCDMIFEAELEVWPTQYQEEEIESIVRVKLDTLDLDQVGLDSIKRAVSDRFFNEH